VAKSCPGGDDATVVDIKLKRWVRWRGGGGKKSEKRGGVNHREEWGERGALRCAMCEEEGGWSVGVERERGGAMLEEWGSPHDEGRGKAEEVKGVKEAGWVKVVEEALDVEKDGRGDVAKVDGGLGQMG
jgi:hypothetical protein